MVFSPMVFCHKIRPGVDRYGVGQNVCLGLSKWKTNKQTKIQTNFFANPIIRFWLPKWFSGKESACQCKFDPWIGKTPWRRKWQHTPVCLPGKFCEQRSRVDYSLWVSFGDFRISVTFAILIMSWCEWICIHLVWDRLCFLYLDICFLLQWCFQPNFIKYIFDPFLSFWDPYNVNVGIPDSVPEVP